jgi:hypothetical protein
MTTPVPTAADRYKAVAAELIAPPPPAEPSLRCLRCRRLSCGRPAPWGEDYTCESLDAMAAWQNFCARPWWERWWMRWTGEAPQDPWKMYRRGAYST